LNFFTSRVAGPNPSHFAPFRDCSLLDTCSRCYTRIAPWLTSSACVARGLRRAQHFSASHHSRIAPRSILGLPRRARIAPCSSLPALCRSCFCPCGLIVPCGSIQAQHFLPRRLRWIAPRSTPRSSHRSRIASRSTLDLPRRARIAPILALNTNCLARTSPRSTFSARTVPELPLAVPSVPGTWLSLLPADCSAFHLVCLVLVAGFLRL